MTIFSDMMEVSITQIKEEIDESVFVTDGLNDVREPEVKIEEGWIDDSSNYELPSCSDQDC